MGNTEINLKKIAVMQPYVFPYIGYFQLIKSVDKFVLYDDVNFINKGWINKNRILLNGNDYVFTIPCENASQNKLIKEINVVRDNKFFEKLLKTIVTAYKKTPNFQSVFALIEEVFEFEKINVSLLAYNSINAVLKYLGIEREIVFSSEAYSNRELKKADRLIDICKIENCKNYINSIGGNKLYEKEYFENKGINISFLKSEEISYNQFGNIFVPNLSIIDILMFNGKDQILNLFSKYTLI